ncbi:AraC family transcriptional regulator [Undibacterium sp. Di26W]|uniref:AraC family transcriptional regulator n=1 Tax=Undibacterium sp. Di26W TaxID=3413035 RepID=UPI003BF3F392
MAIEILTDTRPQSADKSPTPQRPVRLAARDLPTEEVIRTHHHQWGQLTYTPQGMMQILANDNTWFVPPLRAIWIPAGVEHEVRIIEPSQLRLLYFHADHLPFKGDNCLVLEVSPLLRELIAGMEQIDHAGPRENHLAAVITDELQAAKHLPIRLPMPRDKRLKSLCEILLADPASGLTLEDYASQVGASSRTLSRLFEQQLDMSFTAWRQQMRLSKASPLITSGLPLSQVAAELGYASQSAFSAMFKKTFGESPSSFFRQK